MNTRSFALDLYRSLPAGENLFFSPFSVRAALGRAAVGARGNTRKQMVEVLGLGDHSDEGLMSGIADMEKKIVGLPEVTLEIANHIFAEASFRFRQDYLDLMRRFAGLELVDFRKSYEMVRAAINDWVVGVTHDHIKDLLTPGSLDAMVKMVLVNAIYFKGKWQYEFDKKETHDDDFVLASRQKVIARMMYQKNSNLFYGQDDAMQMLLMPYKGKRLARLVLLPRKGVSLASVEEVMSKQGIGSIVDRLRRQSDLHVYVPKFEMGWGTFNMTDTLVAMGMGAAFSGAADFSGMEMDGSRELYISKVFHKAWVKDDEEGTEAAAATAVVMRSKGISLEPQTVFRADHPFVFVNLDTATNEVLFMGRMADPSKCK